jgi:DNA-binding NarL/FixJ family response regulator
LWRGKYVIMTYKVFVVDDHALIRHFVRRILEDGKDLEVTGEAGDGEALLEQLGKATAVPDLVILDISMPGMGGIEAARRVRRDHSRVKVLIMTVQRDRGSLREAMAAGVSGYLLKDDASDELLPCVDAIRNGGTYISHRVASTRESLRA